MPVNAISGDCAAYRQSFHGCLQVAPPTAGRGSIVTGTGNRLAWTSRSASDYGVTVRLSRTWVTAPGDIFVWDATSWTCNAVGPVWCIGDFYRTYLPAVLRN